MCGIAGIYLKRGADHDFIETSLQGMQRDLFHRGPDSGGMHADERRGYLNRRLAIVGIAGGDQPIYNTARDIGIVYAGEVYNYQQLKRRYVDRGTEFHTATDTEVVLQAFAHEGTDGFRLLEGMFTFCVWNDTTDEVYLVRDAFGMKPLYIYEDERMIVFASEIGAILNVSGTDSSLDPRAIRDYLAFRYTLGPYTIYRHIRRVAAGTYVQLSPFGCREYAFADLAQDKAGVSPKSYGEAQEELRRLLTASVQSHLIGEVPIALLLSGGVDSSILAAILHRLDAPMACFNIGFPEVNEFAYSSAVAQKYGFPMHNIEITQETLIDNFRHILAELDEPIADPAQFPLYLLCKHVKEYATVVLSGEGADELFGGYPQYLTHDLALSGRERLPHFLKSSYYFLDGDDFMREVPVDGGWHRAAKFFRGDTVLGAMSNFDLSTWIPENLMMKADKMAMRHSLEGRFPYLNRQLVALVRSLPPSFLIGPQGAFKKILKDAFGAMLPDSVLNRPKMGFTVPVHLLLDKFRDLYLDALASLEHTEFAEIVNLAAVRSLFGRFLNNDREDALRNWTLFVLTTWVAERYRTAATV